MQDRALAGLHERKRIHQARFPPCLRLTGHFDVRAISTTNRIVMAGYRYDTGRPDPRPPRNAKNPPTTPGRPARPRKRRAPAGGATGREAGGRGRRVALTCEHPGPVRNPVTTSRPACPLWDRKVRQLFAYPSLQRSRSCCGMCDNGGRKVARILGKDAPTMNDSKNSETRPVAGGHLALRRHPDPGSMWEVAGYWRDYSIPVPPLSALLLTETFNTTHFDGQEFDTPDAAAQAFGQWLVDCGM